MDEDEAKWVKKTPSDYLPAFERVECAEDSDLCIAGCCWLVRAGDDEGTSVCDGAVSVEGVEDELLESFGHGLRMVRSRVRTGRLCGLSEAPVVR